MKELILILVLSILSFVYPNYIKNEEKYAIIFDAGSKGTRMYVYQYELFPVKDSSKMRMQLEDSIEQKLYCELEDDGLGSYVDASQISGFFSDCMHQADQIIPADKRPQTKISVLATAGMRLLEVKNKTRAENLFDGLRAYLNQSKYYFNDPSQVRTISGKEEGILSFISANYFKSLCSFNQNTKGILDMGGSSVQIAFVPSSVDFNLNIDLSQYLFDVKMANYNYKVYSYSFLCFGTNQILFMYNAKTIRDDNYGKSSSASCYPEDYDFEMTGEEILDNPCTNGLLFDSSHDFTVDKKKIDHDVTYTLKGDSKKNKCREEVNLLIPQKPCRYGDKKCSFNGVYLPPVSKSEFFALGNFYEAIDLTSKLLDVDLNNDIKAFDEATYEICSMSYSKLKDLNEANGAGIGKKRLAKLCIENVYIIRLWELYGFDSLKDVDAVEYVYGKKFGWILGYLINDIENSNHNLESLKY
ncbi:ectonucleoside triphosphate diphosphohydrolase 1 [Brachionus plicatilis]|uniref:Ectonucleoside triphosphate diphosphohydrolase 1 n=1 Tax=Brachionus plicatilis TaxID=10195 RepID=A0A3M7R2E6_BRAPC|nr:ectonucleoside triphosphate diphosphohydrolase 1 [Brachionus plicatilis]